MSYNSNNQIEMPINHFWNTTDPALPYSSSAPGNPGLLPPSNATRDAPPKEYPVGTHPCWDYMNLTWAVRSDYRQVRLWDKETATEIFSSTVNCPTGAIDVEPPAKFAKWDERESKWVVDEGKIQAEKVAERQKKKSIALNEASNQIEQLEEVIEYLDGDDSSKEYEDLLKLWKQYRAKVNLIKTDKADVVFPEAPKKLGD